MKIPVGLTIGVTSDEYEDATAQETGVGWNAGVMGGVAYNAWRQLVLMLELGWQGHGTSHDFSTNFGSGEVDITLHQFALYFGAGFRF